MSMYDPDLERQQREHAYSCMRAWFIERDVLRRKRFAETLASIREPSTRSPAEVAELHARLARLQELSDSESQSPAEQVAPR